jgi:predicted anti-sigma-YlaC factor YlaD
MSGHISDEQWAAAALHENEEAVTDHGSECAACQEELRLWSEAVARAREEIRGAAEQPESFWRKQRAGIATRLMDRAGHQPWKRLAWATATVTLVLLATLLLSKNAAPTRPQPQADPDDALLLSVQQSIRSDLPRALRPTALITREIDRAQIARRDP